MKSWSKLTSVLELFITHNDTITMDLLLCFSPALTCAIADMLAWSTFKLTRDLTGASPFVDGKVSSRRYSKVPRLPTAQFPKLDELSNLVQHAQPLVDLLDYHLAENPYVFSQLIILSERYIVQFSQYSDKIDVLCKQLLLPLLRSLSVSGHNATYFSIQIWQVLRLLPFQSRFALYELLQGVSKPLLLVHAEKVALQGAKHEMKRLAKENTKQIGRNLSKYLHSNPHAVISHILNQIESFDNLVPYIVEALKFSTDLSRDVCALSLIGKLKANESGKIKSGQTSYSPWFLSLSKFISTLYGKFPTTEVKGLLHYLLISVQSGGSADLLILKDLLGIMGGCTTLLDVSLTQLEGLAGGKSLRSEVLSSNSNSTVSAKQAKKSGIILRDELLASGTAMPLLLFIAQIRSRVLFEQDEMPLKLISQLYDTAQDVLMQFSDFLVTDGKALQSIAAVMPPISALVKEVRLSISVAFQLVRPLVRSALQSGYDSHSQNSSGVLQGWHPFSSDIASFVRENLENSNIWSCISERLYIIFWSLSVYDIYAPSDRYHTEIKRLKDKYAELDGKKHAGAGAMSSAEYNKIVRQREADMKALMNTVASLSEENVAQKRHVEHIRRMMLADKESYFSGASVSDVVEMLMQHLVISRALLSPSDAVYSVKFLYMLHDVGASRFSLLVIFNEMIRSLVSLLFSTTEAEASFIGYALREVIQIANGWADSKVWFQSDYLDKTCCADLSMADLIADESLRAEVSNSDAHNQLVALVQDWHRFVFNALQSSFVGGDYIYVRSGLITLSKISSVFPHYVSHGKSLVAALDDLITREVKREDLQIMARSVSVVFRKKNNNWIDDVGLQGFPQEQLISADHSEEYARTETKESIGVLEESNNRVGKNNEKTDAVKKALGLGVSSKSIVDNHKRERSSSKSRSRANHPTEVRDVLSATTKASQEHSAAKAKRKATEGERSQTPPGKMPRRGNEQERDHRDNKRDDSRERRQQQFTSNNQHQQIGSVKSNRENNRGQPVSALAPPMLTIPPTGFTGSTYNSAPPPAPHADYSRNVRSRDNRDSVFPGGIQHSVSAPTESQSSYRRGDHRTEQPYDRYSQLPAHGSQSYNYREDYDRHGMLIMFL